MSRTYKDKSWKYKNPEQWDWSWGCEKILYEVERTNFLTGEPQTVFRTWYKPIKGMKTKKRKEVDYTWHWMSTPSWWTRLTMNRPQRRECHLWEHEVAKTSLEDLEDLDSPSGGRKPHIYYW